MAQLGVWSLVTGSIAVQGSALVASERWSHIRGNFRENDHGAQKYGRYRQVFVGHWSLVTREHMSTTQGASGITMAPNTTRTTSCTA